MLARPRTKTRIFRVNRVMCLIFRKIGYLCNRVITVMTRFMGGIPYKELWDQTAAAKPI